jgi:imidazolonepropionase-like amidohydrolase
MTISKVQGSGFGVQGLACRSPKAMAASNGTFVTALLSVLLALPIAAGAEGPRTYAIRGARIVTAAGAPIASGTVLFRDGLVEGVGTDVRVPDDARVIDGAGLTVYPGLIDMANTAVADIPRAEQPRDLRTTEELERWKRGTLLRPQLEAVDYVKVDSPELRKLAAAGVTTVLAVPDGGAVKGRSALVNVAAPEDDPQIGAVADPRHGLIVVKSPVALHVGFAPGGRQAGVYPTALMGVIAFVRQSFLDGQHQQLATEHYAKVKGLGEERPVFDPALDALQPALAGRMPVAFEAERAREVLRALNTAQQFKLDPVIVGGLEADQVAADLKARNGRVIYSLNYPSRPRTLAPEADEPLRVLRERARAARTPASLQKAGVPFAFGSNGLKEPKDFVKNAAKAVREGLPAEAAIRALTIEAARIAGVSERLGSIEKGKIANLIVTDGDLFDEKTKIKHVFVDGRPVEIEEAPAGRPAQRPTQ